jgi:LysM repeat protein
MENLPETDLGPSPDPESPSLSNQRFKLSTLEILFGSLIVLGLFFMAYFIFFQEGSGKVSKLEKKLSSLEGGALSKMESLDQRIKAVQEGQARMESRLQALEAANRDLTAKLARIGTRPVEEKKSSTASQGRGKIQYKVKKGETLQSIARKFKVSANDLSQWNKLGKSGTVRPGDILVISLR